MNIPKIMHFVWYQGFEDISCYKNAKPNIEAWQKMNPDWEVKLWDEMSLLNLFVTKYPKLFGCWRNLNSVIKKCDMARYVLMYEFGGLYIDCDMHPLRPLGDLFADTRLYYHDLFATAKAFHPTHYERYRAEEHAQPINYNDYDILFGLENFRHENSPPTIASSFISSKLKVEFWMELIQYMVRFRESKVLLAFGPHRLSAFMNDYMKTHQNILVLPSYYILWDEHEWGRVLDKQYALAYHEWSTAWGDQSYTDARKWDI